MTKLEEWRNHIAHPHMDNAGTSLCGESIAMGDVIVDKPKLGSFSDIQERLEKANSPKTYQVQGLFIQEVLWAVTKPPQGVRVACVNAPYARGA